MEEEILGQEDILSIQQDEMKRTIKEYIKNQFMQQIKYHEKSTQTRLWVVEANKVKQTAIFSDSL